MMTLDRSIKINNNINNVNCRNLDYNEIGEICKDLITDYVDIDPNDIDLNSNIIFDLGIDSFSLVAIIASIEDYFRIKINTVDLLSFSTVNDAIKYIYNKIN